jgi:hypothetical protein
MLCALQGAAYDVPENAASHGCGWPVGYSLPCPTDWRSGYYEATVSVEDDGGEWTARGRRTACAVIGFILRARPAADGGPKILLQLATNSYQAYNNWGGHCFYNGFGQQEAQGSRLSFRRPSAGLFHKWEHPFVHWAEGRGGYQLDYCANLDLEDPGILEGYELVLSVGHDECQPGPFLRPVNHDCEQWPGGWGSGLLTDAEGSREQILERWHARLSGGLDWQRRQCGLFLW